MSESLCLSDDQLAVLDRALLDLEKLLPRLEDLLVPSCQAPGGERVASSRAGSRPPLSTHVLDVKISVGQVLSEAFLEVWPSEPGPLRTKPPRVNGQMLVPWLRSRLHALAQYSWAPEWSAALVGQVQAVASLVDPDYLVRSWPVESVPLEDVECPVMWSTSRRIAAHAQAMGVQVHRRSVQRWAEAGDIDSRMQPDGTVHYCLSEVVARARAVVHD